MTNSGLKFFFTLGGGGMRSDAFLRRIRGVALFYPFF